MTVTIKDVAKEAGVSPATVSRVIHDHDRISEKTKIRVREAMQHLGYVPNLAASSLAGKRAKTIGIVLPNNSDDLFRNSFFINAMRGISIYAQQKGYFMLYSFSQDEQDELRFIENYIRSGWVSGVILLASREDDKCVQYLDAADFPYVLIGHPQDAGKTCWVDNDNFQAMYQVVNYLADSGCREIGFVGGPASFLVTSDRLKGYRQALSSRALSYDPQRVYQGPDFSEASGYAAVDQLLFGGPVDAIAATDDELAFGVMRRLSELGLEGKVSVTGFNNTLRGQLERPYLTTVDVNADKLGAEAAELLIALLETGKPLPVNHYLVETELIVRETTNGQPRR